MMVLMAVMGNEKETASALSRGSERDGMAESPR